MQNKRIINVRKILAERKIDGLLITNFFNIFYLTGFKTLTENEREAFGVVTDKNVYLITDERYLSKNSPLSSSSFAGQAKLKLINPEKKLIQILSEIIQEEKIKRLGFEQEDLKYIEHEALKERLSVDLIPTSQLIIRLREIKETEEIKKIKKACEISDCCLKEIAKTIKTGQTEKEIAWKMEKWLKEKGFDFSFYPIVAIDQNSSMPHYDTKTGNNKKTKKGSLILIDFGVKYQDYNSDITRIFFVNKPNSEIINTYSHLLNAQNKAIKQISHGTVLKKIDEHCRLLITDYRLPIYPHSTGHGVGLEVHEYPKISPHSKDLLKAHQVFTVEPGVYLTGKWGMRIEDTVLIDNNLKPVVLTKFSKKLIIL